MKKHWLSLLLLAACGPETPKIQTPTGASAVPDDGKARKEYSSRDVDQDGSISGRITFKGAAPQRPDPPTDSTCKMHAVRDETFLVNPNGTLRNVFVYIRKGAGDWKFQTPSQPAQIDQIECRYVPHVQGMMVRQPLRLKNSDPMLHDIRSDTLNESFAGIGERILPAPFATPEVMIRIHCNVHNFMGAYVGVLRHPFFSVTGEDGAYKLSGLPPGDYEVEAWHESAGRKSQTVKVEAGQAAAVDFQFD